MEKIQVIKVCVGIVLGRVLPVAGTVVYRSFWHQVGSPVHHHLTTFM